MGGASAIWLPCASPGGALEGASDRERVEHLFGLYEKLTAPLLAAAAKPKRGRKK
jgi:hypothetical protein